MTATLPSKPRKVTFASPNKIRCESGHTSFDRYCNYIGTGNVISQGQISGFIRSRKDTECNDRTFAEGTLREFDIKPFRTENLLPAHVEKAVMAATENNEAILYMFSHFSGKTRIVHGFVITSTSHKLIKKWTTGPTHKSEKVVDWCAQFVAA